MEAELADAVLLAPALLDKELFTSEPKLYVVVIDIVVVTCGVAVRLRLGVAARLRLGVAVILLVKFFIKLLLYEFIADIILLMYSKTGRIPIMAIL